MIKLCMFDLDGTVADTIDDLCDATNYALKKFGFDSHTPEEYKLFVGNGVVKLAMNASGSDDPVLINKLVSAFDEYYSVHLTDKTKTYDGCPEMLEKISACGVKCGVLSNKPHQYVKRILSKLYPNFQFVCTLGKQEGYEPKPDPSALLKVLSDLGISKEECMYIGDSNVDIITAQNAGVLSCGVTWGFRLRDELVSAGARFLADKPNDVYETVCTLCNSKK